MARIKLNARAYGLFELKDGKWARVYPNLFGSKDYMVRVCQDSLLAHFFDSTEPLRELRPIGNLIAVTQQYFATA